MLVMFTALRHTPGMKKENGFTLIETLVAVSLVVILSASGLYGWDGCGKPPVRCEITCCFCATMPTATTATIKLPVSGLATGTVW